MRKHVLAAMLAVGVALALPLVAVGKGATSATISGPGLDEPIALEGSGEPGSGAELGAIAEQAGFFGAVFTQSPDPMLDTKPKGDLGARYTVTYVMPGPDGQEDQLVQDVYPYARPWPVTYLRPGQEYFDGMETRGGWFVASYSTLLEELVAAGLPAEEPSVTASGDSGPSRWLVAILAACAAAAGLVVTRRLTRVGQTSTETASRSAS